MKYYCSKGLNKELKHGYVNKLDVAPLVLIPVGGIKSCQGQSKFCTEL